MARTINCHPLISESRFESQTSPCDICVEKSGIKVQTDKIFKYWPRDDTTDISTEHVQKMEV